MTSGDIQGPCVNMSCPIDIFLLHNSNGNSAILLSFSTFSFYPSMHLGMHIGHVCILAVALTLSSK